MDTITISGKVYQVTHRETVEQIASSGRTLSAKHLANKGVTAELHAHLPKARRLWLVYETKSGQYVKVTSVLG